MKNTEKLPSWLVIDPRTAESVEVDAVTRGAAARDGARDLNLKAETTEPDVLAREVVVLRQTSARTAARESWPAEAATSA